MAPSTDAVGPESPQPSKDLRGVVIAGEVLIRIHWYADRSQPTRVHEPSSRSPPALRNASSARARPPRRPPGGLRTGAAAGARRTGIDSKCWHRRNSPWQSHAVENRDPVFVPANVAEQPALLEYGLWIVLNLQSRAESAPDSCRRNAARPMRADSRSTIGTRECETPAASPSSSAAPRRGGPPARGRSPGSRRRRRAMIAAARQPRSRSMSPVISSVCSRLVGMFGSSRRASACAASDSSKSPQ